jgi:hypothetical protein
MPKIAYFNQQIGTFEQREVQSLKDMQQLVDGLIEPVQVNDDLDFVFNEEGLIREMKPSVIKSDGSIRYVGPFFIARLDAAQSKYVDLHYKDWQFIKSLKVKQVLYQHQPIHVVMLGDEHLHE